MKKITIIAGPTASGKTSYAIEYAKEVGGEIINADSLQVYRENPIISAQPTLLEQQGIPHHLFGYINGAEEYTVARWIEDAKDKVNSCRTMPILVGGTGFYLKHLIFGLSAIPDIPEEIRTQARGLHSEIGNEKFHQLLRALDPIAADRLPSNDYIRVLRAYEVIKATGSPISYWQTKNISYFPIDHFELIILAPNREKLYHNCNQRFLAMLEGGVLEEVKQIINQQYNPSSGIMKSHGIPELGRYLSGEWSLDEAIDKSQQVVRNYAKRQTTWFKHQFNHPNLKITFKY